MNNLNKIINYYSDKIKEFGTTPRGVDWNSLESQNLRFKILSSVFENEYEKFSVLDFGCGYGAYLKFLKNTNKKINYFGYDLSIEMINKAKEIYHNNHFTDILPDQIDYTIASGIFNVKLENDITNWENYIFETLDKIDKISKKGFSFNLLTSYSDKHLMKDNLYYGEPEKFFKHCKLNYSKNIMLDHSYELYEFTIIVKK